uniref:glutathione-specific gamma-glutamylcyclotransferase n=1 Tax=Ornithodoros turicata TaxID=34597 RepID=A0A2R5L6J9_9ACAR
MWVFGYGSLMWKVDFPYEKRLVGYVQGYVRRFWQASEDHRGVPGNPGRVVTLIPSTDPDACVWGVAYEIHSDQKVKVLEHLDYREKDGYDKVEVVFHPQDTTVAPFKLTIYVAHQDNPFFVGPASEKEIASQIHSAEGPSGSNREYVLKLAEAMRTLVPHVKDQHLFDIEHELLMLDRRGAQPHEASRKSSLA